MTTRPPTKAEQRVMNAARKEEIKEKARDVVRQAIRNHAVLVKERPFGGDTKKRGSHDRSYSASFVEAVERNEIEGLEAIYKKFGGDPIDLAWNQGIEG